MATKKSPLEASLQKKSSIQRMDFKKVLAPTYTKVNHEGEYYSEDYGLISLENYASLCIENNKLEDNLIDSIILQEDQKKLKAFLNLALRCAKKVGENRPNMIDVAKELQRIKKGELQAFLPTMECLIDWN
ncbi:hypothetical protein K7X08_010663 [Anisodus acutangulus]|uniref:Uncharacterized protein n=1 Tax=Anisodus acutangulus TaxID=402998 RepID=A0A9Q1LXB8_9SOLA|nr:hypothetical protein K7X08_010663 [Anisodus acutangulus]